MLQFRIKQTPHKKKKQQQPKTKKQQQYSRHFWCCDSASAKMHELLNDDKHKELECVITKTLYLNMAKPQKRT